MLSILTEAAQITQDEPHDEAQGKCRLTLSTGERVWGRVSDVAPDGVVAFDLPTDPDFTLFIRLDAIIAFKYV